MADRSPLVLLVGPVEERLATLATVLARAGFAIEGVARLADADSLVRAHRPRLAVLSVQHRTLRDDLSFVQAARASLPASSALLTVVDGRRSSVGRILRGVGVDYVLASPVDTCELLTVTGAFAGVSANDAFWSLLRTAVGAVYERQESGAAPRSVSAIGAELQTPTPGRNLGAPHDGDVLVSVLAALGSYEVAIVSERARFTSANHRRAVSHAAALGDRLRADVWFTPDHAHFLRLGAYRSRSRARER